MNKELLFDIKVAAQVNEVLLLEGPPGIGKSASIIHFCEKENNMKGYVFTPSQRNPEDMLGLPWINKEKGTTDYLPPSWLESLWEHHRNGFRTYLFLDELTTAPPLMQSGMLRTLQERVVGEKELPPNCFIIAACNPVEWAANGHELDPPVANRFTHIKIDFNPDDFISNFTDYWGDPPKLFNVSEETWKQSRRMMSRFLARRRQYCLNLPQNESERSKAWPSPRTIDKASRYLAACSKNYLFAERLVTGAIGENAAKEFFNWYTTLDLISPEEVFANPKGWNIQPDRLDRLYAILGNCYDYLKDNLTKDLWNKFWVVLDYVASQNLMEVSCIWFHSMLELYYILKEKDSKIQFPTIALTRYKLLIEAAKIVLT